LIGLLLLRLPFFRFVCFFASFGIAVKQ
jgi:hypothetical protein